MRDVRHPFFKLSPSTIVMMESTIDFKKHDTLHCDKKGSRLHCTTNPGKGEIVLKPYNAVNIAGKYIEMINEDNKHLDIIFGNGANCQSMHMTTEPRKIFGTLTCATTSERE